MKPHYRLTASPDAIASDASGDLYPYLFPSEDDCPKCERRIMHTHNQTEEYGNA